MEIMRKLFNVAIEGNIGAGKSTMLKCFSKENRITAFPEPVEKWRNLRGENLFELFMREPLKWAFPFQCLAFQTLLEIHTSKIPTPVRIMERSVYSVRHCFAKALVRDNILHPIHGAILDEWHEFMKQTVPMGLDMIIYMRVSPEVALSRIRARNRPEEVGITLDYTTKLHQLHEDWLCNERCSDSGALINIINADLSEREVELEALKIKDKIIELSME